MHELNPLERELSAELPPDHALAGKQVRAVASSTQWTGRRELSVHWPSTELFDSLESWKTRGMQEDHQHSVRG